MYNEIASNKRKTWLLITIFSILIIFLFLALGIVMEIDPILSLIFGTAFAIGYSLISFYIGDKVTLLSQGAKPIEKRDAFELYTIVENLSITAGIPTPKIYVIDDPAPNAFATGRDPNHATVAVTTGLLQILNKQELQGVIAHEISHIKNYDIRIMTVVVILIGVIIITSDILRRTMFFKSGDSKKGGNIMLAIFLVGLVLGILSPFIAEAIKLAISRTREYLADASGVLLTRYPDGLASALEKISNSGTKMKKASHATAHLYISDPYGKKITPTTPWYKKMFLTHPPTHDRIAKLRNMGI
ncbi:MAG: M48 family metalloprotease [Patescibacteria group bacterium]